jgi:hypothetical protein
MGHGKVWKSGTAMMPGFGATRKKARTCIRMIHVGANSSAKANGAEMRQAYRR